MDKCSMFWCIIAIFQLGAAATPTINQSITDNCKCPCSLLPRVDQTELPQATNCCDKNNNYRYKCIDGYLRRAGTSELIRCTNNQWDKPNLFCKRDPKSKTQKPTTETKSPDPTFRTTSSVDTSTSAAEKESSVDSASDPQSKATVITDNCKCPCSLLPRVDRTELPEATNCCKSDSYYVYKCIDGYVRTAGTSELIKCKDDNQWSEPNLICKQTKSTDPTFRTTSSVDTSTSAAEKESSVDSASDPQSKATVITAEKESPVNSGPGPQSTATVLTEPTTETKSTDPTFRTTSSVDTSTSAAEKESSVDSVSDPQSKAPVITAAEKKSTVNSGRGPQSTAAVLTGVSVVVGTLVLFALMGIGLWIHFHNRRLLKHDSQTISEEQKPMYPYLDAPSRPNY